MVDCLSLIECCKAFEQQKHTVNSLGISDHRGNYNYSRSKHSSSMNPLSHPFCYHSPFAVIDIIILILALGVLGVLTFPYFKFFYWEASYLLHGVCILIRDVIYNSPVAYAVGFILAFVTLLAMWEVIHQNSRKCGNLCCKGFRKAVEFDIQLESEECAKYLPPLPMDAYGFQPLDMGSSLRN